MREIRSSGLMRGTRGNPGPYSTVSLLLIVPIAMPARGQRRYQDIGLALLEHDQREVRRQAEIDLTDRLEPALRDESVLPKRVDRPMPNASVSTAVTVKPGVRRSALRPMRASRKG